MCATKKNQPSKFAYLICDPGVDDNPIVTSENLQSELKSIHIQNLVLSSIDAKSNPTALKIKVLKYLKDNYFYFTTICRLYDQSKFKSDHYLFLYAFSNEANYFDIKEFESNLNKRYGNALFLPFQLDEYSAERLMSLSKFRDYVMSLYSVIELDDLSMDKALEFNDVIDDAAQKIFSKALNYKTRSSQDLEYLTGYSEKSIASILTCGWHN